MRRTRTGKKIEITARDIEIFKLLERYRYLRSTFIHAFVGGASATRLKERLGHLYHECGYLDRPLQQWQFANARHMPVVYENTDAAREVLRQHGILSGEQSTAIVRSGTCSSRQFAHSLMICEILASIELGATAHPNLRFVSWSEILAKAPEGTRNSPHPFRIPVLPSQASGEVCGLKRGAYVVPDGLFGLEYTVGEKRSYRFFALEADRATMPVARSRAGQTSYLKKILAYREIATRQVYKSHLGLPNLLVLTVTASERHKERMMSALRETTGTNAIFLFKAMGAGGCFGQLPGPSPSILAEPWDRAGHPPFGICDGS